MTEADLYIPPQPDPLGDQRKAFKKVSLWKYWWYTFQLWWALRGPRRVIREAIAEAKARGPKAFDGHPEGYQKTGPPPEIPRLSPTLEKAFHDAAADPRYTIVKPDIGDPLDVDLSQRPLDEELKAAGFIPQEPVDTLKGKGASHA
jgi:hypothetical protein